MSVRSGLGAARRRVLCSLYRRTVPLGDGGPIVSFSFDDFPRTALSAGGAILEQVGARGTYYAAIGLMNTSNELGEQFRSGDLDSLLEKGHELASHTFNHISCRSVSGAEFREDVAKGRKAIEEVAGVESANFAYPFGHVTLQAKRTLGLDLGSARSIVPGFNGPEIDLNLLRANSLYGDLDEAGRAEELILENMERKNWLIFYTHDVRSKPSAFGCTPALLEAAVSCAVRRGCRILTVREALAEVGVEREAQSSAMVAY
jgi:peptidoglycan/xylan/chitin deacetylase (PgdA/CDA1 family)